MCTKEYNFFTSWITNQGTYNEDAIQVDQFRILNYLHDLGYADAQVDIDVLEAQQCDRIIISITATKGEQYYCGPITFEGNCILMMRTFKDAFVFVKEDLFSRTNP